MNINHEHQQIITISPLKIYQRIKQICQQRHVSIARLARNVGISKQTPYTWQKGVMPSVGNLYAIANYLNVSLYWLIAGEQSPQHQIVDINDSLEFSYHHMLIPDTLNHQIIGTIKGLINASQLHQDIGH